ncbi:hypothetical protein AgCh_008213 [Apium graveolens]
MIFTSIPDSPSLKLREEPHSNPGDHHLLDDLLDHQPILSDLVEESVSPHLKSIHTDSTIMSLSISTSFPSSTDISHPLTSGCSSTDKLNSSYPLISSVSTSTDTPYPLMVSTHITESIPSVEDMVTVQSLLGLREGSDNLSERLGCSQEKREVESQNMHAISSSMAKVSERSATLVGEGEGVRVCVSPGEPLMQEYRENERKAGTEAIRVDPAIATYQLLAAQGNVEAEQTLNIVHTSESLQRDKAAVNRMPSQAGEPSEEFEIDSDEDRDEEECEVSTAPSEPPLEMAPPKIPKSFGSRTGDKPKAKTKKDDVKA